MKLMRSGLMFFLVMLVSTVLVNTSGAAEIKSYRPFFQENDDIWFELKNKPNNEKDWIGIYPAGSTNDWGNVVSWVWARDTSVTLVDQGDWYKFEDRDSESFGEANAFANYTVKIPPGEYEARFFLNNSYILEDKASFTIESVTQLTLDKQTYASSDTLEIDYSGMSGNLDDWFGVYKKVDTNDWGNVKEWTWSPGQENGSVSISYNNLPIGDYEVRAFFNDSFDLESSVTFTIANGQYWEKGRFTVAPIIELDLAGGGNGFVYSPEEAEGDLPVVLFASGGNSNQHLIHSTVLNFIASHGYHAVFINNVDWHNPALTAGEYIKAVDLLKAIKGVDTSHVGIVGHSSGGGAAFGILKNLKKAPNNYGNVKSFLIAIDPWFAYEMRKQDLQDLPENTNTLILQFGEGGNNMEVNGNGNIYSTDALIPLSLFKYLNQIYPENVDYRIYADVGSNRGHLYLYDNLLDPANNGNNYESMKGGLEPLGAIMELTFDGNEAAKGMALGSNDSGNQVINPKNDYRFKCEETNFGATTDNEGRIIDSTIIEDVKYCIDVPRN